jgi:hypothetical protein
MQPRSRILWLPNEIKEGADCCQFGSSAGFRVTTNQWTILGADRIYIADEYPLGYRYYRAARVKTDI